MQPDLMAAFRIIQMQVYFVIFFKANCMTDMPVSGCLKRGRTEGTLLRVRLCSGQEISDENIQREKSKCQALLLAAMC